MINQDNIRLRKNFTLSPYSIKLLDDNVPKGKQSHIIDQLLAEAYGNRKFMKGRIFKMLEEARELAEKCNYALNINVNEDKKEINTELEKKEPKHEVIDSKDILD